MLTEESRQAALAGLAAHKQNKFWEYNALLWENQPRLGDELYVELAKELELDIKQFNEDRASAEILEQAQTDFEDGQSAGIQGTPHFIINGKGLSGAQPIAAFIEAIEAALAAN
ncbi:MAG: protein-disulfide isomerase [bacterium]